MVKKHSKAQLACTSGTYYQWITDHPCPPDWRRNWPRVTGKVKGRAGLEPRVSLWHTHCGQREHQPSPSRCPDPLPAHRLSLPSGHFLGQRAKAVSSTVFGCGIPRCSQGRDLCPLAQGQARFCPEKGFSREILSLPQLTGGNAPRSPAQTPACGPVSLGLGGA